MRIDGPQSKAPASKPGGAKRAGQGGGGFSALVGEAPKDAAGGPAGVSAAAPAAALWAVQAVDSVGDGAKRRRRRAESLLDSLDELRLALIEGRLSPTVLRRLSERLASVDRPADDPRLSAVMAEIELRAAVELAKLEVSR